MLSRGINLKREGSGVGTILDDKINLALIKYTLFRKDVVGCKELVSYKFSIIIFPKFRWISKSSKLLSIKKNHSRYIVREETFP